MSSNIPSPEHFQDEVILKAASDSAQSANPVVTVVTVCFNPLKDGRQRLLAMNLDSVERQTGLTLEHLIIDGASSDGTLDFLSAYKNRCHDIRILSKADSGIYEAMNRGIALARGKYVIFLNSDDYYHRPDGLALSVKALEESGCSFTFAPVCPEGTKRFHTHYHHPQRRLHKIFVTSVLPHPSMLYRKTVLTEMSGYDQTYRLAADYDLTLRLIASGHKGCFVNCCFATFVMGGLSTQDVNRELDFRENIRMIRNAHREAFGVEFTEQESEFLVERGWYPRKYLSVYVASQALVGRAFMGLPKGLAYRFVRCFNYVKYYLKSLFSSSSPDNAGKE